MTPTLDESPLRRVVNRIWAVVRVGENVAATLVVVLIAILPALEVVLRKTLHTGILANADYVQHLVVWLSFLAGMITSREENHLALTAGVELMPERARRRVKIATSTLCAAVSAFVAVYSLRFVMMAFEPSMRIGVVPLRPIMLIMPVGIMFMAVRFLAHAPRGLLPRVIGTSALAGAIVLASLETALPALLQWPLAILLIAAGALGAPVFVVLGGIASIMFWGAGGAPAVIANEAYTMLSGPAIPTIPLFALTGFILSESKAGARLVQFFRAAFGWLPGGLAIMTVAVCAFFTTFTGASGVTILALGGLLAYALTQTKYSTSFSTGLLTASGSIGLLFAPSLPIILYGVVAHVNIKHLFVAGLLPGVLMMAAVGALGVRHALVAKVERVPFNGRAVRSSFAGAAWELALPFAILFMYLRGLSTLVETSSMAVLYALFVTVVIRRDLTWRDIPRVIVKCLPMVGGVLVVLAMARGLSYFIIDAEIPVRLAEYSQEHVHSKYVFLLLLNVTLLIVGCFMDIFSAIVVVVPLVVPLADVYGVNQVHLAIIFLANLELGYLTPPVGINLFLASYRFEQPLSAIYRHVTPFLLAMIVAVLVITYFPWLTTGLLEMFGVKF